MVVPGSTETIILLRKFIPMIHARVAQAKSIRNAVEDTTNYKKI